MTVVNYFSLYFQISYKMLCINKRKYSKFEQRSDECKNKIVGTIHIWHENYTIKRLLRRITVNNITNIQEENGILYRLFRLELSVSARAILPFNHWKFRLVKYYSHVFDYVEVDSTFYRIPSVFMAQRTQPKDNRTGDIVLDEYIRVWWWHEYVLWDRFDSDQFTY